MSPDAESSRDAFSQLARVYGPVAAFVFAVVVLSLVLIGYRYRAGRGHAPSPEDSRTRLEIGFALVLAVAAIGLVWRSYTALSQENAIGMAATTSERPAVVIDVDASRWNWRFTYPGNVVQTGDGRHRPATLVVPAHEPVRFRLTSSDVAHAFWIPQLRAKYDALPGRTNAFGLRFQAGADYSGSRCSEYCGEYHDQMTFSVDVRSPAAFAAWLRSRRAAR